MSGAAAAPPQAGEAAVMSFSAWVTPHSLSERRRSGQLPRAEVHVNYPYGKQLRHLTVELDREALLRVIANAADALRLLDAEARRG